MQESVEMMRVRIERMKEDISQVLAANAANAAFIDKYATSVMERLKVLTEDLEKIFEKS